MTAMSSPSLTIPPALHAHYRAVRMRPGQGCSIWFIRLFLLPHTLVGLFFLLAMPASILWAVFGADHAAAVDRLWTTTSKNRTRYHAAYVYDLSPGRVRRGEDTIDADLYQQLQRAAQKSRTLRVHALGDPPLFHNAVVRGPADVWKHVGSIWLFGLFWNGVMSIFVYFIYYVPWRLRRLYHSGTATIGQVISKRVSRGKSTSYFVRYRFDAGEGAPRESETSTDRKRYEAIQHGAPVIILYDPARPRRNVAYDYGLYYCPEAGPTLPAAPPR
jgi:hypothetical protein